MNLNSNGVVCRKLVSRIDSHIIILEEKKKKRYCFKKTKIEIDMFAIKYLAGWKKQLHLLRHSPNVDVEHLI